MLQVKNLFLVFRLFKKIKSYTVCIKSSISHDLVPKKWEAAWRSCSLLVGPFCVHQQPEFYLSDPLTCCRFTSTSHQSSTVLRCLWGETAASMLWGKHSDFSAVLPQQDQWGFPGCPLWPWPQPLNPPAEGFESSKTCLNENHASNCFFFFICTWHGPWAATASLFSASAGAEGAAVKSPVVLPELPLHIQNKWRTLQESIVSSSFRNKPKLNPFCCCRFPLRVYWRCFAAI